MDRDKKYWIVVFIGILILALLQFAIGDVIIDSQTNLITPFSKVLLVLISGSILVILVTGLLRRSLLKQETFNNSSLERRSAPRALSIIPLIRSILFTIIIILTTLVALAEGGIDIGHILAGAGVVGLVLGLGAQSLLRDILAGVFYIIDDAFRLGEYVEIGNIRGTVERISLRSVQIRHHRGALQTVPYGTILSVSNLSRDWVIVKMMFQLALDTDTVLVKRVVKEISQQFLEDENFAPSIIEPLKFQGIENVDLYGITVRLKFMAHPGEQFTMRREMIRRLQNAFRDKGIQFARRSVTVSEASAAKAAAADDDEEEQIDGNNR